QTMIQGKPPLTDSDYAGVRRSVRQTIATRERRRTWTLRALQLGLATLAIAFVTIWLVRTPSTTGTLGHTQIAPTSNPATQNASNPATPQPRDLATQSPSNPATQLSSTRHAAHVARRRSHHHATT